MRINECLKLLFAFCIATGTAILIGIIAWFLKQLIGPILRRYAEDKYDQHLSDDMA